MKRIYLDNHTTTKPSAAVVKEMMPFLSDLWGVPSAPNLFGQELLPAIEQAYRNLYRLFGASDSDTVILVSSGAEAVNHAILAAYFDMTRHTGKNHFVTSQIDEAPMIMAMGRLEQLGCSVKMANANKQGKVTAKEISEAITPRTALVSLCWANGLTGVIHDVAEIAKVCQSRGILFHLDASHVLGKIFFDLTEITPDLISFNGDHIHGPKGTGALYIRSGLRLSPFILGGQDQGGQRAGAVNVAGLAGLGIAAKESLENLDLLGTEIARLRGRLESGIKEKYPETVIFFEDEDRLPNCTAMAFPGITNDAMMFALNRKGVFGSFGGGSFQKISLILIASGVDEVLANSAISFSLSRETTEEEIDQAVEIIASTAKRLRKLSVHML
jgi:cysteine desulfurase